MFKRILEILLSIILGIIFLIPIILISLLIFFSLKANPIYWSKRVGINNKLFDMPKFRTMQVGSPEIASHLIKSPGNHITKFGFFLRRFSLDEIPQIYSIIKGDLTFVGPRPALFNQEDLIELRTNKNIHQIKPGITGWAQVNGRDKLSIKEKVEYDYQYLKKKSLVFNLYILFLTFVKILNKSDISH